MAPTGGGETTSRRWTGRPVGAFAVRALAHLLPLAASIVVGVVVSHLVPPPAGTTARVGWWAGLATVATVAMVLTDRVSRRLMPLAALLELTMAFPDEAPSRLRTAVRAASTRHLEARLAEARAMTADSDRHRAAELILELVASLNVHDRATRGHSERVKIYTELLAEELGIKGDDRDKLRWAALLHDIGKLAIPAAVLNKPGALDDDEFALIKTHPAEGMKLCAPIIEWLGPWAYAIADHQEKYNGTGYPARLEGEQISWAGRIVAVADVFEVITATRSYKKALPASVAREELAAQAGRHFDPRVVRAFLNISLGRLRLAMGPVSWLLQLPLLAKVSLVPAVGTLAGSVTTVMALSLTGLVANHSPSKPVPEAEAPFADVLGGSHVRPAAGAGDDVSDPAEGGDGGSRAGGGDAGGGSLLDPGLVVSPDVPADPGDLGVPGITTTLDVLGAIDDVVGSGEDGGTPTGDGITADGVTGTVGDVSSTLDDAVDGVGDTTGSVGKTVADAGDSVGDTVDQVGGTVDDASDSLVETMDDVGDTAGGSLVVGGGGLL